MHLFIVVLVVTLGQCNFIKKCPIRLLFWQGERGSRLVSRCIVVLCTRLILCLLSFVFACCHLSLLAAGRLLLLRTMTSSSHFHQWSLLYVVGLVVLIAHQCWALLFFAQCCVSSFCRVSRWFFTLCHCFFALRHRLLGHFQQVISLWGLLTSWLDFLDPWGPLSLLVLNLDLKFACGSDKLEQSWGLEDN